jgi:hypothetical protein
MAKHRYLRKANDQLVSHCRCAAADALITSPGQMDCPWCGCGWLFTCVVCRKAFTFAEAVEVEESWEALAERDIRAFYRRGPEEGEVEEWIQVMQLLLRDIRPGERYVYLDGWVIAIDAEDIDIEGWHSRHELDIVPQVAALEDPWVRSEMLGSPDYWQSNAIDRKDD